MSVRIKESNMPEVDKLEAVLDLLGHVPHPDRPTPVDPPTGFAHALYTLVVEGVAAGAIYHTLGKGYEPFVNDLLFSNVKEPLSRVIKHHSEVMSTTVPPKPPLTFAKPVPIPMPSRSRFPRAIAVQLA
jgi:hypothetical protein